MCVVNNVRTNYSAKRKESRMTKRYTKEIHWQAVNRYFKGKQTAAQISHVMNIPHQTVGAWITAAKSRVADIRWTPRRIRDMCAKVKRLESIISVLKSVECTVNSPQKERLREMERLHGQFSSRVLCDALEVPRGTYLNHIKRNKKEADSHHERRGMLKKRISAIHDAARQIYGAAKIAAKLKEEGIRVSKEMVHELMQEMGLYSIRTRAKAMYRDLRKHMGNRVMRSFNPDAPNKIWVSDVTEFNYKNVTIYICAIMDLFSRKIIGCKFSHSNNTHLLKMTFRQAYDSRQPREGLIFHSDRGGNYRSRTMQLMLKSLCIEQSFSKSHTPYDNSVSEAFFKSLKTEELYRSIYRSEAELKACISKYIEFFNNERPHKTLNYLTPAKKEEIYFSKHQTQTT